MVRWVTFDCYGTLIDWEGGMRATLARVWPDEDVAPLLDRYYEIEPRVQQDGSLPYREVLHQALVLLAESEGLALGEGEEYALADSLPSWTAFSEVPSSLEHLRERGFRLAILSNTDPDFLAASMKSIGVRFDATVTAADTGSYKPAHGHWTRFFERSDAEPAHHAHVAASLFHDIAPAAELGLTAVWINRLGETSDLPRAAELTDLARLPDTLDELVPAATL
jgi:2-haloacid dehalogenase